MNKPTSRIAPELDCRARIAHDIKSPINIILSSVSMLRTKTDHLPDVSNDIQQYLHYIEQNCYRLLHLADFFLDSETAQSTQPRLTASCCDIRTFVSYTLRDLQPAAEQRGIELTLNDQIAEPCCLNFDRDQLERMLWNLIINALKHSPRGGAITIILHSDSEYVYIGVSDNGSGISSHILPDLFDPCISDGKSEGYGISSHGIGLPVVRQLAELHRGTIFVSSTVDNGTCFTFSISRHLPFTLGNPSGTPT